MKLVYDGKWRTYSTTDTLPLIKGIEADTFVIRHEAPRNINCCYDHTVRVAGDMVELNSVYYRREKPEHRYQSVKLIKIVDDGLVELSFQSFII